MKRQSLGLEQESKRLHKATGLDITEIPAQVWNDSIFPKLSVKTVLGLPKVCTYFRDVITRNEETEFRRCWIRYSTQQLNPGFVDARWNILRSLVFGRCAFCPVSSHNFHYQLPAYVCFSCTNSHPWMASVSKSKIANSFHINRKQVDEVLDRCTGFAAVNFHVDYRTLQFPKSHMRYLVREVAISVYELFGGRDAWLAHWHTAEAKANKRRTRAKDPLIDIGELP